MGLFDYHESMSTCLFDTKEELIGNNVKLCLNRFKMCHTNASSHTYELNIQTEKGKRIYLE